MNKRDVTNNNRSQWQPQSDGDWLTKYELWSSSIEEWFKSWNTSLSMLESRYMHFQVCVCVYIYHKLLSPLMVWVKETATAANETLLVTWPNAWHTATGMSNFSRLESIGYRTNHMPHYKSVYYYLYIVIERNFLSTFFNSNRLKYVFRPCKFLFWSL